MRAGNGLHLAAATSKASAPAPHAACSAAAAALRRPDARLRGAAARRGSRPSGTRARGGRCPPCEAQHSWRERRETAACCDSPANAPLAQLQPLVVALHPLPVASAFLDLWPRRRSGGRSGARAGSACAAPRALANDSCVSQRALGQCAQDPAAGRSPRALWRGRGALRAVGARRARARRAESRETVSRAGGGAGRRGART